MNLGFYCPQTNKKQKLEKNKITTLNSGSASHWTFLFHQKIFIPNNDLEGPWVSNYTFEIVQIPQFRKI